MGTRRYGQYCGLARALDLLGDRWTLLVVRELLVAPRRYSELLARLAGISTNLLADRLRELAAQGLVVRPEGTERSPYRLVDPDGELRTVVYGLTRFGMAHMPPVPDRPSAAEFQPEWALLALAAMAERGQPPDRTEQYEFTIGTQILHLRASRHGIQVQAGPAEPAALRIRCDPVTFLRVGTRQLHPMAAVLSGQVQVDGDVEALWRCTAALGLPAHVALPVAGTVP